MTHTIIPGKPLSESLSTNLKTLTGHKDRVAVSKKTGVSVSTIRDVIYSGNVITAKNAVAIRELILIALEKIKEAKEAEVIFEEVI